MKYCTNCGTKIKEDTKFCTNCGAAVTTRDKELISADIMSKEKKTNYSAKKILIIGGIIVVLFFVGRYFILKPDISKALFDIDEEVEKIEGKWYDPTGVMLKDKKNIIVFKSSGSIVEGKDRNNTIKISMIPVNKNNYYATVILDGIKGEFNATYYNEENKLVFFSTLTKTSWNIVKLKD